MKKFFRSILSGSFFIILALLIELGVIVFFQFFLEDFLQAIGVFDDIEGNSVKLIISLIYVGVRMITGIIAIIIFFKVIVKNEAPEFKIPWIVGMILMPFFFSVMYIIFGNHKSSKKDLKRMAEVKEAYKENFRENGEIVSDDLRGATGTFKYIRNITGLMGHKDNRVTYYKNGEEFFPELMRCLRAAKEFIFIEFFIITDGKLWSEVTEILKEKAKEGVEIKIIYDDMGSGGNISYFTPRRFRKQGIECHKFHPFRPIISAVYNNRDHRKIVIVDHQVAFTGGMNLADEYANIITRFGYWKDNMIKVEGSDINNFITIFFENYNLCVKKLFDYNKYLDYEYPRYREEGLVMTFGDGPGDIDNALVGEQTFINMLSYARKNVYISTPYLVPTYQLIDSLRNAALRGVKVHLILPGIPDKKAVYKVAQSNFRYLLDAGVKIFIYKPGFNHMKSVLIDDKLAFVGTINFDFRSLVHHFECGTVMYKKPCIKDLRRDFDEMIEVSEQVPTNYVMKKGRLFCTLAKIISPLL